MTWLKMADEIWDPAARKAGIILGMGSANERWRYNVTSSLIGWAHTHGLCKG